jgi:cystathionine gamma-synthase
MKQNTLAARAGLELELGLGTPINPAIHQSTVYAYPSLEDLERVFQGETGYFYYRNGHPNATALESLMVQLEGGQASAVSSSGMSAISALLLGNLQSGDHIIADQNSYGGTFALLTLDLPRFGLEVTFVDVQDTEAVRAAFLPNTKWLHLESLSNPTIRIADIAALATLAKSKGVTVCVDNTFASPALLNPIALGADVVVHSLAKFIGGHGAVMGGALVGRTSLVQAARAALLRFGGTIAAMDAWLALLGAKTLGLRMAQHSQNGLAVAQFLEAHPKVSRVDYPGLPSHAQHQLAKKLLLQGYGSMMSFELEGGLPAASSFIKAINHAIPLAPSLADVSSTLSYPAGTSHRALTPEARARIGVTDGLLRLSVGIEDTADIMSDLAQALDTLS